MVRPLPVQSFMRQGTETTPIGSDDVREELCRRIRSAQDTKMAQYTREQYQLLFPHGQCTHVVVDTVGSKPSQQQPTDTEFARNFHEGRHKQQAAKLSELTQQFQLSRHAYVLVAGPLGEGSVDATTQSCISELGCLPWKAIVDLDGSEGAFAVGCGTALHGTSKLTQPSVDLAQMRR